MNQDNNFNQNNFNSQGNNGMSNNQPLNNQNFNQNMNVNQSMFNQQPQPTPSFQQPIMQEPTTQPMNNTFESGNAGNYSFNSKPPKKMNLGLIIGVVAAVVFVGIGVAFGSKLLSNSGNNNNSNNGNNDSNNSVENNDNNSDSNSTVNYDELMEMRVVINDNEIILNKTTIDDFLESSKWKNYEESSFSTEVNKAIVLKDGVNEITLTYLKSNNVIFQVTTNADFDNSVTKIQYKDSYIGTLNIGDNISEEKIKEKYTINERNYRFDIRRTNPSDLIILYEKSSPIVLNYLYHDEENNLTGFSAWWYIY